MVDYIKPVASIDLAEARARGALDPAASTLVQREWEYLANRRGRYGFNEAETTSALALSGGGIRSAAFALGVMQRLAASDYLRLFDYLSTVSGGGYIGSSLTWLTSTKFFEKTKIHFGVRGPSSADGPFPYGSDDPTTATMPHPPRDADQFLTYLRSHGQYLIPGGGITLVSGIAVVLRGILLNLAVWFPITVFLVALMRMVPAPSLEWLPWRGWGGFFCLDWARASDGAADKVLPMCLPPGFSILLLVALVPWAIFILGAIVYSFGTYFARSSEARRYRFRREFERLAHWVLLSAFGLTVVATLPWVADALRELTGEKGGFGALLSGIAGGVWSFFKSRSDDEGKVPLGVLAPIVALLFGYGFLILAYDAAGSAFDAATRWTGGGSLEPRLLLLAAVLPSVALGYFVNLNHLTLHRYYRDRLMEAFMPDIAAVRQNRAGPARDADPALLSAMCNPKDARGPYHLINTNLILTGTEDKARRTRGGDSFLLSPRYCGSNATGWRATDKFFRNDLTLPSAMAISGAAANPDAGTGGVGITRNPIVSIVMSLFNLRLACWIPNPNRARQNIRPNHFEPGLADIVDYKRHENSRMLRLSDGGHFDNLGLYELVRRRVAFIVVCDAGADPDFAFSDLTTFMARIEQDFGARVAFDDVPALRPLIPANPLPFPRGVHGAERGHARATITYADGSKGTLLYLTTMIVEGLRLQLLGYRGANPDFPDETTADQFFSEAQFEAYRELGYVIASRMLGKHADAFEDRLRQLGARGGHKP